MLLKYENYEVVISEEALLLKPFKQIWQRDKTKGKSRALNEIGYIYFMYDPRSDYMFIVDEEMRDKDIKEGLGMKPQWRPDKVVNEAIELYKTLTTTTAGIILDTTRKAVDQLREQLLNIDYSERTTSGSAVHALNSVINTLDKLPALAEKIIKAEKVLNEEIKEQSKMRGAGTKKILEDGL